jgi:hypothetical protein
MKDLIECLLFLALLKFLGVSMWIVTLGSFLYLIGFFVYMSTDSRRKARKLAEAAACERQKAEEIKEAERVRRETIADAEWNARFV